MMNELRLAPLGLLGCLVAVTSGALGCATGASISHFLDDAGGSATDGGLFADAHIGAHDTGTIVFIDSTTPPSHDTGTTPSGDTGTTGGCTGGTMLCAGSCVDTTTNLDNCGTCGNACTTGQSCSAGVCGTGSGCSTGDTSCGGICTDLTSDPDNCGSCGNICPGGSCTASACGGSGGCSGGETSRQRNLHRHHERPGQLRLLRQRLPERELLG